MKPPDSDDDPGFDDLDEIVRAVAHAPPVSAHRSELVRGRLGTILRGKYHLEALLGVGGMAVVYKATHRNQAEYAIKMLLPEYAANEELRARFLREGYAANSVKHAGAVRVVDDDVAEDGTAFLVLELLRGLACDELCAACGGRLPVEAVCAIGLQALDVLQAAHVHGIIHRDIKPANLFVLRNGAIKVLDFGIARARETLATGTHTTGSGVFLGTPAFMAPEQALGKTSEVDARADIWAIGATLFAMMSGVTVHEGDSGRELLVRLVTRPTRSLLAVMPEAPKALADVVDRALAADRDSRWTSAAEMRESLEQVSRQLWGDPPSRPVLASLVESNRSSANMRAEVANATPKDKPSPVVVAAAPTLRAQEHSETPRSAPKMSVETSRPVSRERYSSLPRRRLGPVAIAILALLSSVVVAGAIAVVLFLGRRDASAPQMSSPVPEPAPSPPIPRAEVAAPVDATPTAENVAAAGASGKPVNSRGSTRQDGRSSSSASPMAHANSPAGAAPPAQPAPPAQSTPPLQPPASALSERPASAPNCNPPYYYDANFNRIFKKECL